MSDFEFLQQVFTLEDLPLNIRVQQFMAARPILRRYHSAPVGWKLLPSDGKFRYRRAGVERSIAFNGRNLQFHALYEDRFRNGYELETALAVIALCHGSAPFFDVGSNWGYYSLLAASLPDFSGLVYAFEPNPRTFRDLTATIQQAGLEERAQACYFGLGREECQLTVVEMDKYRTGDTRLTAGTAGTTVPVKPMDALGYDAPGMIKIDAEGMELEVLAGARKIVTNAKPFIILENFLDYKQPQSTYEVMRLLREHAYRIFIPVLVFGEEQNQFLMTYGSDFPEVIKHSGNPRLGIAEISVEQRFLYGGHLNLLAVPASRVPEVWERGVVNLSKP